METLLAYLSMGLFRGAVCHHGGGVPLLNGPFSNLNGLIGRFSLENPLENSPSRKKTMKSFSIYPSPQQ